jgi:hypothetical protein
MAESGRFRDPLDASWRFRKQVERMSSADPNRKMARPPATLYTKTVLSFGDCDRAADTVAQHGSEGDD